MGDNNASKPFNAADNVARTRSGAGMVIGEVLVRTGLVTPQIKNVGLVIQAAERTLQAVEKVEQMLLAKPYIIDQLSRDGSQLTEKGLGHVAFDDQLFKFVGDQRDAPEVRYAQGVMYGAQLFLNDIISTMVEEARHNKGGPEVPSHQQKLLRHAPAFIKGFKTAAIELYAAAADAAKAMNFGRAADDLSLVATEMGKKLDAGQMQVHTPDVYAGFALQREGIIPAYAEKLKMVAALTAPASDVGNATPEAPKM